jgi:V/A-type H+-transporting ATPase subunit D
MLAIAAFEVKMKRLGEEVVRVTRRIRVLEERVLPGLRSEIKDIARYIGERERESFYRLKRFKEIRKARQPQKKGSHTEETHVSRGLMEAK